MVTFGLVHGSQHGAWCWERLTPELERRGHRVVAPGLLPGLHDGRRRMGARATAAAAATARLDGEPPIVIDGGHSPFLARPAELAEVLSRIVE